jgi:hypothetical protein
MRTAKKMNNTFRCAVLAGLFAAGSLQAIAAQQPPSPPPDPAGGFQEFSDKVQEYVKLRKPLEGKLPKLKSTKEPELIEAHQKIMARKIREAREHAKQGDIFTPKAMESFKQVTAAEFQGPQAPHAKATMKQGELLKKVRLRINHVYPKGVPYTSVPPTLLQKLPTLPQEVVYRIVSNDLVLLDEKANVVLDYIPGVIPSQAGNGG